MASRKTSATAAAKTTPKTDDRTVESRLERLETAMGPQLGIKLADHDAEAVATAASEPSADTHTSRPLTDKERLTRLEIAVAASGVKLYTHGE